MGVVHIAQTEINNLESFVVVKKQILRFQVSVANPTFVNVFDTGNKLLVHSDSCFLMQPLMRDNVVEQLSVLAVLHDKEQFALSLDDFVQLDHIGVPHLLKDLDLPTDSFDVLLVFYSRLFKNFDSYFLVCKVVRGKLNLSKCSFA